MDLGRDCPKLLARCRKVDCTLGEFADRVHAFVTELIPLHPLFADLRLVGKNAKDSPPLLGDLSNLEDWIVRRSWMDKMPTGMAYTDLGADGKPTRSSRQGMGFQVSLSNLKGWDGKVDITYKDGDGTVTPALCNLTLARKNHPEFQEASLMRRVLEVVVRHSSVRNASVANGGWHNAINWIGEPSTRRGNFEIGWLTYVDDPTIATALPPGIAVQPLGTGVLFQLGERFSSYEREEDVALGLRVKAALEAAGKLRRVPATA